MTAETSNARGEWVLVPREPTAGMWDSAENAMIESECAYNAGEQAARSDAHGFPTMRIWQAVVGYRAMLAATPPPPAAAQQQGQAVACRWPSCACTNCAAGCPKRTAHPPSAPVGVEALRGAVARGWCADETAHKIVDPVLAEAIVREVAALAQQPAAVDGTDAKLALANDISANDISRVFGNTNKAMADHLWSLGYRKVATQHQEPTT